VPVPTVLSMIIPLVAPLAAKLAVATDPRLSRQPSIVNHNLTALIQPAHGVVRRGGADNKVPRRSGGSRRSPNPNRLNLEESI
jgi:hypothetical protein